MTLICAGEAFDDLIFVGLDRLPNLGEEVKTDRFTSTIGGGAVITAVKAARLGIRTALISALSDAACARLRKERVQVTNLRRAHEPHAITAALSAGHDRAFVTYNGVNTRLEARLARELSGPRLKAGGRRHLHLCFYPQDCRQWARTLGRLRKRGITTSWDFGWNEALATDPDFPALIDGLDFIFVNEHEALLYSGARTINTSIRRWRQRAAITIIKVGEAGAIWVAPDRNLYVRAPKVNVVDTTGAGDSFNAGFLVAWMKGATPEQCLKAGNKVGAASTRKAGGM